MVLKMLPAGVVFAVIILSGCINPVNTNGNNSASAGMKYIHGGAFQMGITNAASYDASGHCVTVSSFFMDSTEVTQADYRSLMKVNPSYFTGNDNRPVECMSWYDAVLYCNARSKHDLKDTVYSFSAISGAAGNGCRNLENLTIHYSKNGYRLPTEAEWEYACRAQSTSAYYWGADTTMLAMNVWYNINSNISTHAVASKLPNPFGLYDMIGNVCEWCNDWYSPYTSQAQTDPVGDTIGVYRIRRGGSWTSSACNICGGTTSYEPLQCAARSYILPLYRYSDCGFRCVRRSL